MKEAGTIAWTIKCWWCKKTFQAEKITTDGFIVCTACNGWSGYEMKKNSTRRQSLEIHDPGQDRLITEVYAWVCEDGRTSLENVLGFTMDGMAVQAISSSRDTAMRMRGVAARAAVATGKRFKLVKFIKKETVITL
jgi:hypothetical protein